MKARYLTAALVALLAGAGAAQLAFGGDRPRAAADAVRLPARRHCVHHGALRVTLVPPAGARFASLSVRAGVDEILQLADLGGTLSIKVVLAHRRTRLHVSATTTDGQFVQAARTYRRCAARSPTPTPTPAPATGGGGGSD